MNQPVKIEEGMYVRTKCNDFCNMIAIRKVEEKSEDDNGFFIDAPIIDTYGDEQYHLQENDISKCSYDLIDLIEIGDYVAGVKVIYKLTNKINGNKLVITGLPQVTKTVEKLIASDRTDQVYSNEDLLRATIVTKEQFESVIYKA